MRRTFKQAGTDTSITIEAAAPEGSYRPKARDLVFRVRWEGEPRRVTSGTAALTRYTPQELAKQSSGWTTDGGFVTIKQPDSFGQVSVVIER
jgi:hypothetical protein